MMRFRYGAAALVLFGMAFLAQGQRPPWKEAFLEGPKDATPVEILRNSLLAAYYNVPLDTGRSARIYGYAQRYWEPGVSDAADFYQVLVPGMLSLARREMDSARVQLARAKQEAQRQRDLEYISRAVVAQGEWYLAMGHLDSAEVLLAKGYRRVNDPYFKAWTRLAMVRGRIEAGAESGQIRRDFELVMEQAREAECEAKIRPWYELERARYLVRADSSAAAATVLAAAEAVFAERKQPRGEQAARLLRMALEMERGDLGASRVAMEDWLAVDAETDTPEDVELMDLLGDLKWKEGSVGMAIADWDMAANQADFIGMNYRWVEIRLKQVSKQVEPEMERALLEEVERRVLAVQSFRLLQWYFEVVALRGKEAEPFEVTLAQAYADTLATAAGDPADELRMWNLVRGDSLRPHLEAERAAAEKVSPEFYLLVTLLGVGLLVIVPILVRRIRRGWKAKR